MRREARRGGASRVYFCTCRGAETEQKLMYVETGVGVRETEVWRCIPCGRRIFSYADVLDADGMVRKTVAAAIGQDRKHLEHLEEEVYGTLTMALFAAYQSWDPKRAVRFRAYAATKLSQAVGDFRREWLGGDEDLESRRAAKRGGPKTLSRAISYDDPGEVAGKRTLDGTRAAPFEPGDADTHSSGLEGFVASGSRDFAEDRSPDLSWALTCGDGGSSDEEGWEADLRALGLGTNERVAA